MLHFCNEMKQFFFIIEKIKIRPIRDVVISFSINYSIRARWLFKYGVNRLLA